MYKLCKIYTLVYKYLGLLNVYASVVRPVTMVTIETMMAVRLIVRQRTHSNAKVFIFYLNINDCNGENNNMTCCQFSWWS